MCNKKQNRFFSRIATLLETLFLLKLGVIWLITGHVPRAQYCGEKMRWRWIIGGGKWQ